MDKASVFSKERYKRNLIMDRVKFGESLTGNAEPSPETGRCRD